MTEAELKAIEERVERATPHEIVKALQNWVHQTVNDGLGALARKALGVEV